MLDADVHADVPVVATPPTVVAEATNNTEAHVLTTTSRLRDHL